MRLTKIMIVVFAIIITMILPPSSQNSVIGKIQTLDDDSFLNNTLEEFGSRSSNATSWSTFHGNIQHTGYHPITTSDNVGVLKWKFKTNGSIQSSPVISNDGTIYIGSNDNYLYAINPDGTYKWKFNTSGQIWATPTIGSDGTIYIGSFDKKLFAINPDGTKKWSYSTKGEIRAGPTIDSSGVLYIGTSGGYGGSGFHAINPDGNFKWGKGINYGVYSNPAINREGIVYVGGNDDYLHAFYPNGTLHWKFETDGNVYCSPSIGPGGIIYFDSNGKYDNHLYALYPDGTLNWKIKLPSAARTSPSIYTDGTIIIGANEDSYNAKGEIWSINPDGTIRWKYTTKDEITYSSAAISFDGTIFIGSIDGYVYSLYRDGTLNWKYKTGSGIWSSPAIGNDGTIYIGSFDGYLYAIKNGPSTSPEFLQATVEDEIAILEWYKPSHDGGLDLTQYKIYCENEIGSHVIGVVDMNTTEFMVSDIDRYWECSFYVTAFNPLGESEPSNHVNFFSNSGDDHHWRSIVVQSNDTWKKAVRYYALDVFYQNTPLGISLSIPPNTYTDVEISIENGTLIPGDLERGWYYEWHDDRKNEIHQERPLDNQEFVMIPDELDINFEMTLTLRIINNDTEVYSEKHIFWVIGEPKVIPGTDLNEDVDIIGIYFKTLFASSLGMIIIVGIILFKKRVVKK